MKAKGHIVTTLQPPFLVNNIYERGHGGQGGRILGGWHNTTHEENQNKKGGQIRRGLEEKGGVANFEED